MRLKGFPSGKSPGSSFLWIWQEEAGCRTPANRILGSSHGGWGFNWLYDTNGAHLTNSQASLLPGSQLQTNAFFNIQFDEPMFGTNGSQYAQTNRSRILADAIPALTLPAGANPVPRLSPEGQPSRNFDMQALYENGWSSGRPARTVGAVAPGEWHHSDFRQMAYTFTYKLFDKMVNTGDLK